MPKLGMEPVRRAALVKATIAELGGAGTLDVTVGQIARRAGMSSALAHHYFGGKNDIFAAAMRQILVDLRAAVKVRVRGATTPRAQLNAIIEGCFAPPSFDPDTIQAWMLFYSLSRTNPKAAQLLRVYQRRLRTHLRVALRPLSPTPEEDAETLAALIDGLYLRAALSRRGTAEEATRHALDVAHRLVAA
ncbi:transcriptional regulator BetI [Aliishimia ponticola]|uniref:HTH-type transcriptional regulator BetI n=1 Tax=Aliishimia ponticola TaxID=2499833 RepID=A0A4S4N9A2_9RHOB|nr:transcriptional regulator BetI [Aliishimia ponticola]THH35816.1 transcriptional regulator BetI [Aliishimia ponticola]